MGVVGVVRKGVVGGGVDVGGEKEVGK